MGNDVILCKVPSLLCALTMILAALNERGHTHQPAQWKSPPFHYPHITGL